MASRAKVLPDGQRWWSQVAGLASDKLEGRQTGSAGFGVALFRFRLEGAEHISPGNRSGGSRHRRGGHAATVRRSARVSRPRRLARPTGLPRSSQTQVSEVFVLAKLTPNEGDLSVKHSGGVGGRAQREHRRGCHAATARRSARVSRPRRLARPTGLPRSSQTQVSEVFVLAKLTPNEGDLSVKHLGGVRRPAPSAGSCLGGVRRLLR